MTFPRVLQDSPTAHLLWELVFSQVKLRYKRSVLGLGWSLLHPFLMMLVFTLILGRFPRLTNLPIPYHIFFLSGYLPWIFFAAALSGGQNALIANASLVRQVAFRKWLLPAAAVGANAVHGILAMLLFALYLVIHPSVPLHAGLFWIIPLFVVQALAIVGLAVALSLWAVSFRDLGPLLEISLSFFFYLTPVFYDFSLFGPDDTWLVVVLRLNPLASLLACYRAAFFHEPVPWVSLFYVIACTGALLGLGAAVYRRRHGRIAKEL
jgi:ABC-type polysaccharide/polyol phosphate export permease